MFTFISGNAGLDFAGTVAHRRTDHIDLLASPADLATWVVEAALLDSPPSVDSLDAAVGLREAIYRLATGAGLDGDRELLNAFATRPPVEMSLGADGRVVRSGDLDAALATVARESVEMLGGPLAARIKECGDELCTRLYLDVSRAGSRKWCGMQECGNRAKAAAFRARQRV
ncbi:CGNR zinc finger domain-containing protein [Nonomuraea sp. NPDC050556]|uniref:CGNR zinc finger domain-containing protein n=1 Tax=Nonomuraea sp. NPDC050556 TaxID=3364369 RepID=UPI0037B9EE2D